MKVKIPYKSMVCLTALLSFQVNGQHLLSSQLTAQNKQTKNAVPLEKKSSLIEALRFLEKKYDVAFFYKDEFVQDKSVSFTEAAQTDVEVTLFCMLLNNQESGGNT
ncbi:hypothetical protein [Adhaeribacter pallidiroseus]|uniref:Uncharacterized protein n=1 Tax=Adhaeribacter pallidiroseus TaxID=2072847 RepID=A0A369QJ58_9BACT|nr:hypothetical protein [Adhaeribacter pallidiroseus]RDC64941.1 hypothetical protein AHMF7616_03563 [Adhaeribacter pallidiroseus]